MKYRLSKKTIKSFYGDVISLRLLSDDIIAGDNITWGTDNSDLIFIQEFSGDEPDCFNDGVLLGLRGIGEASVWAKIHDTKFCCAVTSQEAKKANPSDELKYYIGDFHAHTTSNHDRETFIEEPENLSLKRFTQVKEEGLLDFFVMSDHASLLDRRKFFQGFEAAELTHTEGFIPFAGAESEITLVEKDHYGIPNRNSGEIVTINSSNYSNATDWKSFISDMKDSPMVVASLAHPQILGYSTDGIWNFSLKKKMSAGMRDAIHLVEMGNGMDSKQNLLHEYTYSVALDCGLRIAPVSTSDSHGPIWGYDAWPGKTVIMAPEKSKEMFIDALKNTRVYATESGNVKLYYTVNGLPASSILPSAEEFKFAVDISYFNPPKRDRIVRLEVVSDYGKTVKIIEDIKGDRIEFTIKSPTARYFYLKLYGGDGSRTWSAPIWTGRPFDQYIDPTSNCERLDKKNFKAVDLLTDCVADNLINGDPKDHWIGQLSEAEIEIDMGKEFEICGLGYYPHIISSADGRDLGQERCANFVSEYEIYAAVDRDSYIKCAEGIMREFGGEEIVRFNKIKARYVKFKVRSTTGRASSRSRYKNAPVYIGEIDIFI